MRATFTLSVVERPSNGLRLAAAIAGEVVGPSFTVVPSSVGVVSKITPLRASRLLQLVGARVPGALFHPVSKAFSWPLSAHDALAGALSRPLHFLPPFARLYAESPLAVHVERRPHESDAAWRARQEMERRDAQRSEYEQLGAAACTVETLAPAYIDHLVKNAGVRAPVEPALDAPVPPCPSGVPAALWTQLFVYQREDALFLIQRGRALLGSGMGTGKTKVASVAVLHLLATRRAHGEARPALVVCPCSLREAWRRELAEWAGDEAQRFAGAPLAVVAPKDARAALSPAHGVTIVSYDMAARMTQRLASLRACVVVCDESHYIKNSEAQRTRAIVSLARSAPHFFALSGTAAVSRPYELYTQLFLIAPAVFANQHAFGERYCDPKQKRIGSQLVWEYRGSTRLDELNAILSTLMVRRRMADVLKFMPPKTRERVFLAVDDAKKSEVEAMRQNAALIRASGDELQANAALLAAIRHTCRVKVPAILQYLDEIVLADEEQPKFLFFAQHMEMLDRVEAHLRSRGVSLFRIDGSTPKDERTRGIDAFQRGELRAGLLSIEAAGVGITLTRATLVLFGELHFNWAQLDQAECRAFRIGQEKPVTMRYLLASGTTDEHVWGIVARKFTNMGKLFDGSTDRLEATTVRLDGGAHKKLKAS